MYKPVSVIAQLTKIIESRQSIYDSLNSDESIKHEDFVTDMVTEIDGYWKLIQNYSAATNASELHIADAAIKEVLKAFDKEREDSLKCPCDDCRTD